MLKYLRGTQFLKLKLSADRTAALKGWVDASYAVHPNKRSHTGAMLSLGKGCIQGTSVKSSTDAELVAVDDKMPHILWCNYFFGGSRFTL